MSRRDPPGAKSYAAIATELGLSRTRVVQIERAAIAKLASALELPLPFAVVRSKNGRNRRLVKQTA